MRIGKPEIRKEVNARIQVLEDRATRDEKICRKILDSVEFEEADIVLGYAAMDDEVDISTVLETAVSRGKHVFLPRISGSEMHFGQVTGAAELHSGAFNIMEPPEQAAKLNPEETGLGRILILVPGRAFTAHGVRLGRGKGFYDRYFEEFEKDERIFLMGVAYTCQIYSELPYYKHDVKMKGIASEDQLLFTQEA